MAHRCSGCSAYVTNCLLGGARFGLPLFLLTNIHLLTENEPAGTKVELGDLLWVIEN